jgi:hypothetical protein
MRGRPGDRDHSTRPVPTSRLVAGAPFVAVLRAEVTQDELEFWRLGGDPSAPVDIGADELVAVVDDNRSLLVVVSAGRLDLDAEKFFSQSEGFLVDSASGDPIGIVNDVRLDPRSGKAVEFDVCVGSLGHHHLAVPAEEIVAVLPGSKRLILDRPPESRGGPRGQR